MLRFARTENLLIICLLLMPIQKLSGIECSDEKIDSLQLLIKNSKLNELLRANASLELGLCMLDKDLDSAQHFAELGFQLAEEINYPEGIVKYNFIAGKIDEKNDSYYEAKVHYSEALDLYQTLGKDEMYIKTCNALAYLHEMQSEFDQALNWYRKGLDFALEYGELKYIGSLYNNMATTMMKARRFRESIPYMFLAGSIFKELENETYYGYVLGNIAFAYLDLDMHDSAMYYLDIVEEIVTEQNNVFGLLMNERSKGDVLMEQGNFSKALDHYEASLRYAEMLGPLDHNKYYTKGWSHLFLGKALFQSNDLPNARIHLNQAKLAGDSLEVISLISESSRNLSEVYERSRMYDSALFYFKVYQLANDTLLTERYNSRVDRLIYESQAQLLQAEHDAEIRLVTLEKQRRELVIFILIGMTFFILVLSYFIWRNQKTKIRIVEKDSQLVRLESENTHRELERKKRELTATLLNLAERNELFTTIILRLQNMVETKKSFSRSDIDELNNFFNRESSKNLWKEFELSFKEIHTRFYEVLNQSYPDLTSNERRICAFLYLNMSTKEIASITFQSEQSIKIARYRLRKKLNLERSSNIAQYLQNMN